jgi:hypothetical protein
MPTLTQRFDQFLDFAALPIAQVFGEADIIAHYG